MTLMLTEVYDAFKDAGTDEKKAREAAEALANYQRDITELRGDNRVLKWMSGTNIAFTMAILWKIFL